MARLVDRFAAVVEIRAVRCVVRELEIIQHPSFRQCRGVNIRSSGLRDCNKFVVEHVERKTLSGVPFEIRLEEVEAPLEEVPGMVKLDAPQLGELTSLVFGAECIVGGCREDGNHANGTGGEPVAQDG